MWEWTERQNKHFRIKISDIPASQFHLQVEIKLESLCRSTGDGKRIVQGKILEREAYIFMRVMVIFLGLFLCFLALNWSPLVELAWHCLWSYSKFLPLKQFWYINKVVGDPSKVKVFGANVCVEIKWSMNHGWSFFSEATVTNSPEWKSGELDEKKQHP